MIYALLVFAGSSIRAVEMYHRAVKSSERRASEIVWDVHKASSFDEFLLSWSSERPARGSFTFAISICVHHNWSPWFPYAVWGSQEQHLYGIQSSRDIRDFLNGRKASGFRVKVVATNGASFKSMRALHVTITDNNKHAVSSKLPETTTAVLEVPQISQIALELDDSTRICSPTSTAAAVSYLVPHHEIDVVEFAQQVFEPRAKLYGAWVLNTVQAAHELGRNWYCYVSRLGSLQDLVDQINRGYPIVVSIQGPIPGSARPTNENVKFAYESGHLLVVRGYDAVHKKVLCMDPAFHTDAETYVSYDAEDFITAWRRRNGLAYIFTKTLPVRK